MTRIGINGFGRVGRQVARSLLANRSGCRLVAINDLAPAGLNAHLLKYDSTHGVFDGTVKADDNTLLVDTDRVDTEPIAVYRCSRPEQIPWHEAGVDVVIEATGKFTHATAAAAHLAGGVRRVLVCAPSDSADITIVLGVNDDDYDAARHRVISVGSCTTNAAAPIAKVLHETFGLRNGLLSTVHAYTNSQHLLDRADNDPRGSRAAGVNIIPRPTGCAAGIGKVIPALRGLVTGMAFRVPTSAVSAVDFTVLLDQSATAEEVNTALRAAADGPMQGILSYTDLPLVSSDITGDTHSSVVSCVDTMSLNALVKIVSWYDNETGYAARVVDLADIVDGS